MAYELIESVTLGSQASSIAFNSIPQDGVDLLLVTSLRSTGNLGYINIGINGTVRSFNSRDLFGTGSGVSTNARTDATIQAAVNNTNYTSNTFNSSQFYFSNYVGNTTKAISHDGVSENNDTATAMSIKAMFWNSATSITSLSIVGADGSSFTANSSASLYKIS